MSDAQTPPQPPVPPQPTWPPVPPASAPQPAAPAPYPPAGYGAAAYAPPGYAAGYAAYSAEPPRRPAGAPGLGLIALVAAVAAVLISIVLSATTGFAAAESAMRHAIGVSPEGLENLSDEQLLGLLSPVRDLVPWAEIGFWVGTGLGIWAIVQGIVAIVKRRGRGLGIAAVIVGALGPIAYGVLVGAAVIFGIRVGGAGG